MSKYHIKFVLTKYVKCYDLSTGFCSVRYWRTRIEKKLYSLHEKIHDNLDFFYFEESYFKMCKKFRHLSLFSVCLHLLTCKRSCEKKINSYCRRCSRVRDNNFFDMDKFQDIVICSKPTYKDDFIFLNGTMIDLDVYLNRPVYFDYPNHPLKNNPCRYMEMLSHAQDLFAYFCSMLVRLYLNYAMEHFCELISTIKLSDEKFVIEKILTFAYELLNDFLDTNYLFYYEFYNVLNEENLSDCYRVASNKPKFGPYIRPQITLEIITL